MDLSFQKRLASSVLGGGQTRLWINPERQEDVAEAITKEDVRSLINSKAIVKRPASVPSRGRAREVARKKQRGQRAGPGSRKGKAGARRDPEELWAHKVRKMRAYLRELRNKDQIDPKTYKELYAKVKGNAFPSLSSLQRYLKKGE